MSILWKLELDMFSVTSTFPVQFLGSLKMLLRGVIIFPLPIFKGYEER